MGIDRVTTRTGLALILVLLAMAVPVLLVPLPPMLDYPNHLARLWLLSGGAAIDPLSHMYRIDWHGASTNLFIDLAAVAAAPLMPVSIVGPGLLIAALLLPGIGISALAGQVHGRLTWWHLLCPILGWSQAYLLGFLNFQIALGLALLGAALDVRVAARSSPLRLAGTRAAIGLVLLVAHPFGLLHYAVLTGGLAMGRSGSMLADWPARRAAFGRAAIAVLPLIALVMLFWLLAPHPGDHRAGAIDPIRWRIAKPAILLSPFKTYRAHADLPIAAAFLIAIAWAAAARRLRVHAGLAIGAAVLAIGALLMPEHVFGTALMDIRLPTLLWLTLAVAVLPDIGRTGGLRAALTAAAIAIAFGRAGQIGTIWLDRRADLESVRRALAAVPPGATILPLVQTPDRAHVRDLPLGRAIGGHVGFWHLATLAVAERHAFVPTLFSNPGKQVVQVRPPYDRIAVPEGAVAGVDKLGRPLAPVDAHEFPYLDRWRCFDYLLVVDADVPNAAGPLRPEPEIVPVRDEGFARLYAIRHDMRPGCPISGLGRR